MVAGSTQTFCYAAEALVLGSRWDAAQAQVDEALELAHRLGERVRIPDLLLLRARVALGQGRAADARKAMRESLQEAREQQVPGFELAALVALCELEGAAASDVDALRAACTGLGEGFDMPPLKRALELARSFS
jgi:hypothetical protein